MKRKHIIIVADTDDMSISYIMKTDNKYHRSISGNRPAYIFNSYTTAYRTKSIMERNLLRYDKKYNESNSHSTTFMIIPIK